jgi:hypothetical protein
MLSGCALPREVTKSPRSAIEQLLLSQALERSLAEATLPVPDGATILVEPTALSADQYFAGRVVSNRLAKTGLRLDEGQGNAQYRVLMVIHAFGTEQDTTFFGIPEIQSVVIPFALPEIPFYKVVRQTALARWSLDVFEYKTGRFVTSSPWYQAGTSHTQYTVLFFTVNVTDLSPEP